MALLRIILSFDSDKSITKPKLQQYGVVIDGSIVIVVSLCWWDDEKLPPEPGVKLSPLSNDDIENTNDDGEADIGEDKFGVISCHPNHHKDTDLLKFDRFRYRSGGTDEYFTKSCDNDNEKY